MEGFYFITICTKNRIPYFGSVENGMVNLNTSGQIVAETWIKTEKIRDRVQLGEWIVMPNHIHGIIYLKPKCRDASNASQKTVENITARGDGCDPSLHNNTVPVNYKNEFGPQRSNISSIMRGFKGSCTRQIRKSGCQSFSWQKGFYDHIIRSQKSLIKIEEYIKENPRLWPDDCYFVQ